MKNKSNKSESTILRQKVDELIIANKELAFQNEEKEKREEALKESEERYRNIFESTMIGIYRTTPDGRILLANPMLVNMLGYDTFENLAQRNLEKEGFEPRYQRKEFLERIERDGYIIGLESAWKKEDGTTIFIRENAKVFRDGAGNVLYYDGTIEDITERKRVEQELINTNKELAFQNEEKEKRAAELIKAKERAEESDRLKSAFLGNMSHEIRTPMNGILGFANLLKEPDLTVEEQKKYISIIEKSCSRLLTIITDIVHISKIEAGQMEVSISETNINQQMEFIYNFFKPVAKEKGIQLFIKNTLPSKEASIKTDLGKLNTILTNLVGNAFKFTQTGFIELGVEKKGDYLEFFVNDTGIGVPEQQKEIIFKRFRQGGDLTSRFNEGAGLGLSISKAFVEMLGGKIWVESELGKGSIFYFTLPYNAETETKTVINKVPSVIGTDNQVKNLKILIVEDDEASLSFLSTALKMYCKEILHAISGVKAVEACRNNPDLDLILMDVRMPDLDGYSATRQIRQFNKDVVIIAQTAYALVGDRHKAIEAGCNDHIGKPITMDALNELIQKYFNK